MVVEHFPGEEYGGGHGIELEELGDLWAKERRGINNGGQVKKNPQEHLS